MGAPMTERESKITLPFLLVCNIVALILLVFTQGGCGASARDKALSSTLVAVNSARDSFTTWDLAHQDEILAGSTSMEDSGKKLDVYRAARKVVEHAFEVAYRALALAAIDEKTPLPTAVGAAAALATAIAGIKNSSPLEAGP